jgi:hypothetical protein
MRTGKYARYRNYGAGGVSGATVVLANFEVADKLGVASLLSIPMSAFVGCAGGGFLGFLSQSRGASA